MESNYDKQFSARKVNVLEKKKQHELKPSKQLSNDISFLPNLIHLRTVLQAKYFINHLINSPRDTYFKKTNTRTIIIENRTSGL